MSSNIETMEKPEVIAYAVTICNNSAKYKGLPCMMGELYLHAHDKAQSFVPKKNGQIITNLSQADSNKMLFAYLKIGLMGQITNRLARGREVVKSSKKDGVRIVHKMLDIDDPIISNSITSQSVNKVERDDAYKNIFNVLNKHLSEKEMILLSFLIDGLTYEDILTEICKTYPETKLGTVKSTLFRVRKKCAEIPGFKFFIQQAFK